MMVSVVVMVCGTMIVETASDSDWVTMMVASEVITDVTVLVAGMALVPPSTGTTL